MANWKFKLELSDFYRSEMPISDKARKVAGRIEMTFPKAWLDPESDDYDADLDMIRDNFRMFQDGLTETQAIDEFDGFMEMLYDYADLEVEPLDQWPPNKMCWVNTGRMA